MSAGYWRWRGEPNAKTKLRSAQIEVERGNGKTFRKTIRVKSAREADKELATFIASIDGGNVSQAPGRMTCGDWFEQWHAALTYAETTKANYRSQLDRWLIPELGDVKLKELNAITIKAAFLRMSKRTPTPAPSALGQTRNVLASAIRSAVKFDMIAHSPLDRLRGELPIGQSPDAVPADRAVVDKVIASLPVGDPNRMALYLALVIGPRRGEVCGLRWRDVEDGKITVREQIVPVRGKNIRKAPKYDSGREVAIGPKVAEALRQHRRAAAEALLKVGKRITADDPVCARLDDKRPLTPGALTSWCARHGIKLHSLRHLNASTLLQTQPVAIVAERLGHSRPDVTLRVYAHVLPGAGDEAARAIDAVI